MSALDAEMPVETYAKVRSAFDAATEVLIQKYGLSRKRFSLELQHRLRAGEILEEPAVTRWQGLRGAMLDWAQEEERGRPLPLGAAPNPEPSKGDVMLQDDRVNLKVLIQGTLQGCVSDFLLCDRKEDTELPPGAIERAIWEGIISQAEMVEIFRDALQDVLGAP